MRIEGMLWGATLRSPHPRARIRSIDTAPRAGAARRPRRAHARGRARPQDLRPGASPTSPCWPGSDVRYQGEAIAIVAADHPETARRAADAIEVELRGARRRDRRRAGDAAGRAAAAPVAATCCATCASTTATPTRRADVVVHRRVRGRHAGPGLPRPRVGPRGARRRRRRRPAHRDAVAARRPRPGRREPRPAARARCGSTLGGVGGAFGGREDLSMQIHACMLALRTRPAGEDGLRPRGVLLRPRAPAPVPDGLRARRRRATAGSSTCARGSCSTAARTRRARPRSARNAACFAAGPYAVPNARARRVRRLHEQPAVRRDARLRRGPGRVRATRRRWTSSRPRSGMDPVELRIRNAMAPGRRAADRPGRPEPAPVAELLERLRDDAAAAAARRRGRDLRELPGGVANTTHGEGVRRGVGYARRLQERRLLRGLRRLLDRARAARRSTTTASRSSRSTPPPPRSARASSPCRRRSRAPSSASSASWCCRADTAVGSAGSSSASRQTYVTGGAVKAACEAVRERLAELGGERGDRAALGASCSREGEPIEETVEWHHRADLPARRERPGRRAPAVRVLRPPRGRRRRRRSSASCASSSWRPRRRSARR